MLPHRPNVRKNERSDVLARVSANIAVLAGGEIWTDRQVGPTFDGGGVELRPDFGGSDIPGCKAVRPCVGLMA